MRDAGLKARSTELIACTFLITSGSFRCSPRFGAACMFFFGRRLSKSAVNGVCVGVVVLAFAWACLAVWQYTDYSAANPGKPFEKVLYTWMGTGDTLAELSDARRHGRSSAPMPASCSTRCRPSGCCS